MNVFKPFFLGFLTACILAVSVYFYLDVEQDTEYIEVVNDNTRLYDSLNAEFKTLKVHDDSLNNEVSKRRIEYIRIKDDKEREVNLVDSMPSDSVYTSIITDLHR